MANQWFKFYGMEYLSDPKMLTLTTAQRSCWVTLLSYASISEIPGEVRYLTEEQLMLQAGVEFGSDEWKRTKGVLKRFAQLGMISTDDNATISVKNWGKRQEYQAMTGYERVKKWRDKQKITNDNTGDNGDNVQNRIDKNRKEESNTIARRFEDFWSKYPRKEGKKKAQQTFEKIAPSEGQFREIMDGLERHRAGDQWKKDDGRFIPHPTTWLNGERWNDEVRQGKAGATPAKKDKYANIGKTTTA